MGVNDIFRLIFNLPKKSSSCIYFQGYEYFGYDPSTYFCSDPPDLETSYTEETSYDDYSALALSSDQDMEVQEQELQIDLGATSSESKILDRDQQDQILCK